MEKDYPIEYTLGEVEFFGRKFFVNPDVLIPRLETEVLVRRTRKVLSDTGIQTIIDIGSGSGIIGISCADRVTRSIFLDISEPALQVAKKNFRKNFSEKTGEFIVSDLLEHLPEDVDFPVIFVANLPYIKSEDWGNMSPDTKYEPKLALFGGERTGFELYERLFQQIQNHKLNGVLLIEFGFDQREIAENILQNLPWEYDFFPDYAGIERFVEIQL